MSTIRSTRSRMIVAAFRIEGRLEAVAGSPRSRDPKEGLRAPLARLRSLIRRGPERTGALWPDAERAYAWVHAAAHILRNAPRAYADAVRRRFDGLMGALRRHRALDGTLEPTVVRFVRVGVATAPA